MKMCGGLSLLKVQERETKVALSSEVCNSSSLLSHRCGFSLQSLPFLRSLSSCGIEWGKNRLLF